MGPGNLPNNRSDVTKLKVTGNINEYFNFEFCIFYFIQLKTNKIKQD